MPPPPHQRVHEQHRAKLHCRTRAQPDRQRLEAREVVHGRLEWPRAAEEGHEFTATCMLHASDNTHMRQRRTYTCPVHVYAACSGHVRSPTRSSGAADWSAICMRMPRVHAAFLHNPRPPHQRSETRAAGCPYSGRGAADLTSKHIARVSIRPMAPTSPQVRSEATYPATGAPRGYEAQAASNCVRMRMFVWKLACRAWTPPSLRCTRG